MAKMRGIKPEIWTDEKFVSVSPLARLLFIGLWNYACDNGHVDPSPAQLKMRILPMDNCDVSELIDELLEVGLIERLDACLKVTNLAIHQRIDTRYLLTCDHCAHDVHTTYGTADRRPKAARPAGDTTGAQRAPAGGTTGPHVEGRKEGSEGTEGEMRGSEGSEVKVTARKRASRLPGDWRPSDADREYAVERGIDPDAEAENFRDYWTAKPGKDATKLDWTATWRTWVRRAAERPSRHLTSVPSQPWTPPPGSPLSYVEM